MNQQIITELDNCFDLGVRRCNNMKYENHARDTAHKAARLSGMVMKLFCTRDPSFMMRLYTSYILPVLEYAAPVWSPSGKEVIAQLERVQRSYTKRIRGMWYLSYDQRLKCLRLPSLEKRRLINDLVLVYKSLHGQLSVQPSLFGINLVHSSTRGDNLHISHCRASSHLLSTAFKCSLPKFWNKLPVSMLNSRSMLVFKRSLNARLTV